MAYEGYANYETWAVANYINNTEGVQEEWISIGLLCMETYKITGENATGILAERMHQEFEDGKPELSSIEHPPIYGDLLQAAIDSVNWLEIAEEMIDKANERSA